MTCPYAINVYGPDMHKPAHSISLDLPFFCDEDRPEQLTHTLRELFKQESFAVVELVEDKNTRRYFLGGEWSEDDFLDVVSDISKTKERAHMSAFFGAAGGVCPAH